MPSSKDCGVFNIPGGFLSSSSLCAPFSSAAAADTKDGFSDSVCTSISTWTTAWATSLPPFSVTGSTSAATASMLYNSSFNQVLDLAYWLLCQGAQLYLPTTTCAQRNFAYIVALHTCTCVYMSAGRDAFSHTGNIAWTVLLLPSVIVCTTEFRVHHVGGSSYDIVNFITLQENY